MRDVTTHRHGGRLLPKDKPDAPDVFDESVGGRVNAAVIIEAEDPGRDVQGKERQCWHYSLYVVDPLARASQKVAELRFQHGPMFVLTPEGQRVEQRVSGISSEALLAILLDRLESAQRSSCPCEQNAKAIWCLRAALGWLQERGVERRKRGVEGTIQP